MSVLLGHAADAGLMLRAAIRESQWRSGMTWRVPLGWVLTDGLSDGLRCAAGVRWWGSGEGWRGLVWCASGLPAGISRCVRFAVGGLAGGGGCHGVVTSGAKHGGTQGDTLRRFLQVGGRGGTSWDR